MPSASFVLAVIASLAIQSEASPPMTATRPVLRIALPSDTASGPPSPQACERGCGRPDIVLGPVVDAEGRSVPVTVPGRVVVSNGRLTVLLRTMSLLRPPSTLERVAGPADALEIRLPDLRRTAGALQPDIYVGTLRVSAAYE